MRVLMVCLGNICRSPLAQGILEEKFKQHNIRGNVDSAGTAAYHQGESPDPRSQKVALEHDIDISHQRARAFTLQDFDLFDKIYVMDNENFSNIRAMVRDQKDLEKVELIMNEAYPGENRQVPDPYYGGRDGFERVFQMLDLASENIVSKIQTNKE